MTPERLRTAASVWDDESARLKREGQPGLARSALAVALLLNTTARMVTEHLAAATDQEHAS